MKIIIASDIHGNFKYMTKLDDLIIKENPDKILLLGDLLYHSIQNNEFNEINVANILNKYKDKIIAVRGNCDSKIDDELLEFNNLTDYKEINIDNIKFILTHGHLNPWLIDIIKDNYVIQGHTHVYKLDGKILNPGSVGIPRHHKEHTCILYDNKEFKLIDLDNLKIIDSKVI